MGIFLANNTHYNLIFVSLMFFSLSHYLTCAIKYSGSTVISSEAHHLISLLCRCLGQKNGHLSKFKTEQSC